MSERVEAEPVSDVILLEGVQVPAALGVSAAERRMRRPVRVDLEIGRPLRVAGESDRIRDTVDYADIYRVVEQVASGREHRLVEALGERIAAALLNEFEIEWVRITVRKSKPIAGVLDHTGIRMLRRRGA